MNPCSHLDAIQTVEATSDGCVDCERLVAFELASEALAPLGRTGR